MYSRHNETVAECIPRPAPHVHVTTPRRERRFCLLSQGLQIIRAEISLTSSPRSEGGRSPSGIPQSLILSTGSLKSDSVEGVRASRACEPAQVFIAIVSMDWGVSPRQPPTDCLRARRPPELERHPQKFESCLTRPTTIHESLEQSVFRGFTCLARKSNAAQKP